MTLCVVAKQSLDEMEQMVVDLFADIVDKKVEKKRWDHPYTNGNIGVTIQVSAPGRQSVSSN
jgi:secreted Zn-dependent insulinase-like peptidase